jgi:NADH:ubiquinone oxidoreductase subunit 6 (subunit J)
LILEILYKSMIINLYFIYCFLLLFSSIFMISINNPIYKILFLILLFLFSSSIFLILDFYFLGFTYFIVYIGAITILFLFIIMMIQLTHYNKNNN